MDGTIIAQAPRLSSHLASMQQIIAGVLQVAPDLVNVKSKAAKGWMRSGREEAIAAQAVCMIERA